jgi:hypothetical protein
MVQQQKAVAHPDTKLCLTVVLTSAVETPSGQHMPVGMVKFEPKASMVRALLVMKLMLASSTSVHLQPETPAHASWLSARHLNTWAICMQ